MLPSESALEYAIAHCSRGSDYAPPPPPYAQLTSQRAPDTQHATVVAHLGGGSASLFPAFYNVLHCIWFFCFILRLYLLHHHVQVHIAPRQVRLEKLNYLVVQDL